MKYISLLHVCVLFSVILSAPFLCAMPDLVKRVEIPSVKKVPIQEVKSNRDNNNYEDKGVEFENIYPEKNEVNNTEKSFPGTGRISGHSSSEMLEQGGDLMSSNRNVEYGLSDIYPTNDEVEYTEEDCRTSGHSSSEILEQEEGLTHGKIDKEFRLSDIYPTNDEVQYTEESLNRDYWILGCFYPTTFTNKKSVISSDQKFFEEKVLHLIKSLEMRSGNLSGYTQKEEKIDPLDVMDLVKEIAKELKITLPFNASDLQDYSLQNLTRDIAIALTYKTEEHYEMIDHTSSDILIKLEREQEGLKIEQESILREKIIQYLQLQGEVWEKGAAILLEISEERGNEKIINFFDHDFVYLSKSFSLCADALQAVEESRLEKAQSLATEALGYLLFTQEKSQPSPREDILNDYRQAFALLQESEATFVRGEKEDATRLKLQAEVLLSQNQERLEDPADDTCANIINGYQRSLVLIERAKQVLDLLHGWDTKKAMYFMNQSKALYYAIHEVAAREPREDIIQDYEKSVSFFAQAVQVKEKGQRDLAESFNGQGLALFYLTCERAGLNRYAITACYQLSFDCFEEAQKKYSPTAWWQPLVQCCQKEGEAWLGFAEESARPEGSREEVLNLYKESAYDFMNAHDHIGYDYNGEQSHAYQKKGLDRLKKIEAEKKKSPENKKNSATFYPQPCVIS